MRKKYTTVIDKYGRNFHYEEVDLLLHETVDKKGNVLDRVCKTSSEYTFQFNGQFGLLIEKVDANGDIIERTCKVRDPSKSRGLGDTIAKVTDKLKIRKCGGCRRRQKKYNELFPYKQGD